MASGRGKQWQARVLADLEEQGARVRRSKGGFMVYPLVGPAISVHLTPGDHRAEANDRARIRRGGLEWPPDRW